MEQVSGEILEEVLKVKLTNKELKVQSIRILKMVESQQPSQVQQTQSLREVTKEFLLNQDVIYKL